jgi:hypothetical protein
MFVRKSEYRERLIKRHNSSTHSVNTDIVTICVEVQGRRYVNVDGVSAVALSRPLYGRGRVIDGVDLLGSAG